MSPVESLHPAVGPSVLARPRLLAILNQEPISPITLIIAPAGYGKTTLVQQWAAEAKGPVAWVPLGRTSNHPDVFLTQLINALPCGDDALTDGDPQVDEVLTFLAACATSVQPLTILLDDLHILENQDVLQTIDALLLARLPHVHWMLISRTMPALTLARLRLEGAVRDIGPEQLSFTRNEVATIVDLLAAGHIPKGTVKTLTTRTAGWIAGIRLAISAMMLESASGRPVTTAWEAASWLDDYFMEEVLASLPEELRSFVLRTVPLPYLDADLCNYVLGISSSAGRIQEIHKRLVFVRPYGADRTKLAYHALFAESVARIASRFMPHEGADETHLRAAQWFEQAGLLEEAAEQAVLAGAWDRAEPIIRDICRPLIDSDHSHSAWYWLRKLPENRLLGDPELARWYISNLHHLGDHQAAADAYATVRPIWQASDNPVYQTYDLLSQTLSLAMSGDSKRAVQKAYEAVDIAPDDLSVDLMHAWTYIYQIESFRGRDEKADHAYREAERHRRHLPADQWYWSNNTELHRVNTEAVRGRLQTAEQMYTHKLENLPRTQFHHDAKLRYRRSAIWLEWNEADRVEAELDDIRQQALALPYRIWHQEVLTYVGQAQGALGDLDGMESTLREVREMFQARGGRHNLNRLEALEIDLWLATGRLPLAQDWARRTSHETYAPPLLFGDPDPRLARVKIAVASGEPDRAIRNLAAMIEDATNRRCWAEIVSLASWQMAAYVMQGDTTSALDALRLALRHGRPGDFVRSFMTPGVDTAPFVHAALPLLDADESSYLTRLVQQGVWPQPQGDPAPIDIELADPLSSREIDVLKLVEPGLRNREIGERLYISERTVKKHIGSILRKLDSPNRRAAAIQARRLGLLDDPSA